MLSTLGHLSATLFRPIRRLAGPVHRRRSSYTDEQREYEKGLPPLPAPWSADDRWYPGGTLPRQHNELTPLPDGDAYFADLCRELETATRRVTIAGWCLTPLMSLDRQNGVILADLLRDLSMRIDVCILLWAGAPALFEPTVEQNRRLVKTLRRVAPRVRCSLDSTAPFSHDHHQKAVTIDGRVAYVGGMDLTTFQGDRWDTGKHHLRFGDNWHDVQIRLQGEVVKDVEHNFCQRWNAVTGEDLQPLEAEVDPAWSSPVQLVRTIPHGWYDFAPQGEFGIRHALLAGIRRAEHFIYLENQYLWAPEIIDALCEVMDRRHDHPFRIVVLLPARAMDGRFDNDQHVRELQRASGGKAIFQAYSLYTGGPANTITGHHYKPIYVHAKVAIVDDEWMLVGSANLNRRGLAMDSEIAVQTVAPEHVRRLRVQLWAEHLGLPEDEVAGKDAIELIDSEWKSASSDLAGRVKRQAPPGACQVHPYVADAHPLGLLLDRLQSATLEH